MCIHLILTENMMYSFHLVKKHDVIQDGLVRVNRLVRGWFSTKSKNSCDHAERNLFLVSCIFIQEDLFGTWISPFAIIDKFHG